MKHIRKFEDLTYLDTLKGEKELRDKFSKSEEDRIDRTRSEVTGKHLDKLANDSKRDRTISKEEEERKEIVQRVIDGLTGDLNKNPGYMSFKEELLAFLDEFPKE